MTPDDVLAMPLGMRAAFDDYQKRETRERNRAAARRGR